MTLVLSGWAWATDAAADDKETCTTAYVDAQTQRAEHKMLSARDTLLMCSRPECAHFMRDQMARDCATWLEQTQAAIPTVVLSVSPPFGDETHSVTAYVDGAVVAGQPGGPAVEVDPGPHVVTFTAGTARIDKTIFVLEGAKGQVVTASFDAPGTRAVASAGFAKVADADLPVHGQPGAAFPKARMIIPLSIGAAGLAVGSVFGVLALGNKSWLDEHCATGRCAPPATQSDIDILHTNAWISNIAFGVGIAGAATAAILWITRRPSTPRQADMAIARRLRVEPWVGMARAGLSGTFE